MKKTSKLWLFVLPLIVSGVVKAADNPVPASQGAPQTHKFVMDDKFIDQQLTNIANLEKRQAEMAQKMAEHPAPTNANTKIRDERIALEKKLTSDRKAFLTQLKSQPVESREAAWREFSKKQADERKAFMESHKAEMDAMRKAHQDMQKSSATPKPK